MYHLQGLLDKFLLEFDVTGILLSESFGRLLDTVHFGSEDIKDLSEEGLTIGVGLEELEDGHLDGLIATIE